MTDSTMTSTAARTESPAEDAFGNLLDTLYYGSLDERDKGTKFERLIRSYLMTDPAYASQFDEVWEWSDYPGKAGRTDDGVDLVARDAITGDLTAIQCKFIDPQTTVGKGQVDSFISASSTGEFSRRIFVSTTTKMNATIESYMQRLDPPLTHLNVFHLANAPIDWAQFSLDRPEDIRRSDDAKSPMPHQRAAMKAVQEGFTTHDRGKLIMACGTGKTYTSLQIMEQQTGPSDTVLFLVPSIALLSQTLTEWKRDAKEPFRAFAVCSDVKVGKNVDADVSTTDLIIPATTDSDRLIEEWRKGDGYEGRTVIFSTYQSIDVLTGAQRAGLPDFDLVICDEAHRTTGATAAGQDDSNFVRVHDDAYVRATKRLYMTATPRVFDESSKRKAEENSVVVASMDDEDVFGPEFHHLGFGAAVEAGLLTDYKVLILTVDEGSVNTHLQTLLTDEDGALRLDEAAQMVGCWKGLATRGAEATAAETALTTQPPAASLAGDSGDQHGVSGVADAVATARRTTAPMRRAVAFAANIKDSQRIARSLELVGAQMGGDNGLQLATRHVDGGMNVAERIKHLNWLESTPKPIQSDEVANVADEPADAGECRILTNARCLSEGVDVPSLDAVMFLSPRNSQVDVVQSVGRVMRRSKGKDFGYIILPVAVPAGATPEEALKDNKKYRVIWSVLNALRSHDDRFDAMVNQLDLNKHTAGKVVHEHVEFDRDDVEGVGQGTNADPSTGGKDLGTQVALYLEGLDQWRDALYAKIVNKVGDREYWDKWQDTIADVAARQTQRLQALVLKNPTPEAAAQFREFVTALRANLNDGISEDDAVSMLAQHLITKPVFDALFEGYDFAAQNPVSQVMGRMVSALEGNNLNAETEELQGFYASVRKRAEGIDTAQGKQRIITELYEGFFTKAFPKQADALGIVYTPVEVVDYILRAVDDLLKEHFGKGITDEGVHVLDPFTGTGTFIVRLLESGLIDPHDLARKYAGELHGNEIMLLAYYIAAVNIEATFHGIAGGDYQPFEGIVLADTFQMTEDNDTIDDGVFVGNSDRAKKQLDTDIRVIVGNPPYSVGQTSANDNNANQEYPTLDARIRDTYAAEASGQYKSSLYDSYVRAMRWGVDRLGDAGVLAYVTNGGYIDANSAAGIRAHLERDFDHLYVYNLRGNQRTAGEQSRKEGGKVFGSGSRATVAILVGVKDPAHSGPCELRYRDIGDYLNRDEKLQIVSGGTVASTEWATLIPNDRHEWINQSSNAFDSLPMLSGKNADSTGGSSILTTHSLGLSTNRDAWVYGYSAIDVQRKMSTLAVNLKGVSILVPIGGSVRAGGQGVRRQGLGEVAWSRLLGLERGPLR
ncbi:DEAD/DEAH box helicase family protein, partial [Brevibacterium sp. Mu109]|uniref:restriction endonuclease n=1 Tax=Brevibacterium sp. Mu109 TaxID=1255669 RepID=UPI0021524D00